MRNLRAFLKIASATKGERDYFILAARIVRLGRKMADAQTEQSA